MNAAWIEDDLTEHFTLSADDHAFLAPKPDATRLGVAVLLKWLPYAGVFPRHRTEIPSSVVRVLAHQLQLDPALFATYPWQGRTIEQHRAQIRERLGFRPATEQDQQALAAWLTGTVLPSTPHADQVRTRALERLRSLRIELPTPKQLARTLAAAHHAFQEQLAFRIAGRLPEAIQRRLDDLLQTSITDGAPDGEPENLTRVSRLSLLKEGTGQPSLQAILDEGARLEQIRQLHLPSDLFQDVAPAIIQRLRQRVMAEDLSELRRHAAPLRHLLIAAFCWLRGQELTDTLIEMLNQIVYRIGTKAENKAHTRLVQAVKRVRGKGRILCNVATAAVDQPEGIVREVVYPVAGGEATLRAVIAEFQAVADYDTTVTRTIRSSYASHYRRMVPPLLALLTFHANNEQHRPVLQALELLQRYADVAGDYPYYADDEKIPFEDVVPAAWEPLVRSETGRVNRIAYEICALQALREKLRCKEIWVAGAARYRNPDDDLPQDFEARRAEYYQDLGHPPDAETFIATVQGEMERWLTILDRGLPTNAAVHISAKRGGWIHLTPFTPLPEPPTLGQLGDALSARWWMTSLLDMLKETDLRVGFTDVFQSNATREHLDRATLQRRVLLCCYGLGTNIGLKRVGTGHGDTADDLAYIRRRFMTRDQLRNATGRIVNALFAVRHPQIWGEGTTACASDSKLFGAWDQNLMTDWHPRQRAAGVKIYWHVDKKAACIYSQLKHPFASEVAAMMEGLLHHNTSMPLERNYVDTHGQSEIAFAFCRLLNFQLMPRFKAIHRQKLYRPTRGTRAAYPQLQPVLQRPINWERIRRSYDQMIKYATALRLRTAETDAILRRFSRRNFRHPTFKALLELGRAIKTIFLCQYLHQEAVRREIHEGLQVVEHWNATNDFIFYGNGREFGTNQPEQMEISMLCLHLVQLSLVYINTLMIQEVLAEPEWMARMTAADLRGLSPLRYRHVNPYGRFLLDMQERLPLSAPTIR